MHAWLQMGLLPLPYSSKNKHAICCATSPSSKYHQFSFNLFFFPLFIIIILTPRKTWKFKHFLSCFGSQGCSLSRVFPAIIIELTDYVPMQRTVKPTSQTELHVIGLLCSSFRMAAWNKHLKFPFFAHFIAMLILFQKNISFGTEPKGCLEWNLTDSQLSLPVFDWPARVQEPVQHVWEGEKKRW